MEKFVEHLNRVFYFVYFWNNEFLKLIRLIANCNSQLTFYNYGPNTIFKNITYI